MGNGRLGSTLIRVTREDFPGGVAEASEGMKTGWRGVKSEPGEGMRIFQTATLTGEKASCV